MLKRILLRSWYYFRIGYSTYLSLPVALVGYASAIYYLAIENLPFLKVIFPHFHYFIIIGLTVLGPIGVCLGWFHFKKLFKKFYWAEQDIQVESNPFHTQIVTPVNLPTLKILSELGKLHNIDTSEIDRIIERTEKKFKK